MGTAIGDSLTRPGSRELLVEALAAWTTTRSAAIAEAVDTLRDRAMADWSPPRATRPESFQAAWLRSVPDPVGRGWAAARLVDQLPGDDDATRAAALAIRMRALVYVGADPRAGYEVARRLIAGDPLFGYFEAAQAAEEVLVQCRDERVRALLAGARDDRDDPDSEAAAIAARVLARPALGRPPTRRELDRFAVIAAPRTLESEDLADLVAEVYARPSDDEPRLVLADALQTHGDPRGELIALQLAAAGTDDDDRLRRIDRLIKACGGDWLGELANVAYRVQFVRGFVARLELAKRLRLGPSEWSRLRTHPMLSTIEELIPGEAQGAPYALLVTSPAMTSLRRIEVFDRDTVSALIGCERPLTHVACPRLKRGSGNYVSGLVRAVLPACLARPTVVSVGIALAGFEAVEASGLFDRLTSLTVGDNRLERVLALWSRLPARCELVAKRTGGLEECIGLRVAWLGDVRLSRQDGEVVGRAWGDWPIHALIEVMSSPVAALPALDKLIVEGATPAQASALVELTRDRGIELVLPPAPVRSGYLTLRN